MSITSTFFYWFDGGRVVPDGRLLPQYILPQSYIVPQYVCRLRLSNRLPGLCCRLSYLHHMRTLDQETCSGSILLLMQCSYWFGLLY